MSQAPVHKAVAILQSSYIPWKGYFDVMAKVDEFVLYDEVQFTKRDWRSRNKIKTPNGPQWLTIPVNTTGKYTQTIAETTVAGHGWVKDHTKAIELNYRKATHFGEYWPVVEAAYQQCLQTERLSEINEILLRCLAGQLGIATPITHSTQYPGSGEARKTERLVEICVGAGATTYLSGPAAKAYLEESQFAERGVVVAWMDYSGYPAYPQLFGGDFTHEVTVLDVLFNCGLQASQMMKYLAKIPAV